MNVTKGIEVSENIAKLIKNDSIPSEWAQIISTDIEKQNQQRIQCPFSDAYSNGMPKKYQKPNKLSNIVNFRESLQKVIKVAKLNDQNSMNEILDDICSDDDIQNNFDQYIKQTVKQHINFKYDDSFELKKFNDLNRYLFD